MSVSVISFLICLFVTLGLTVMCGIVLIPILRKYKVGQTINPFGPAWHASKAGTPMMGGLCFILPILVTVAGALTVLGLTGTDVQTVRAVASVCVLGVLCASVGFFDDYKKLIQHQSEGLTSMQKMLGLLLAGGIYLLLGATTSVLSTSVFVPILRCTVDLGFWFWPLALFLIAGMTNSVNITDGLDGLASTVMLVIAAFWAVVSVFRSTGVLPEVYAILGGCFIGAMVGFLVFNYHPAKVFMGDTGALFLGGSLMAVAFLNGNAVLWLIPASVYILNGITSFLQIVSIRLFHKKLFSIAPFHHVLEQWGWKESQVVTLYGVLTLAFCVLTFFLL